MINYRKRLKNGLHKLEEANKFVESMKIELASLGPIISKQTQVIYIYSHCINSY